MSSSLSSTGLGAYFRHVRTKRICAGRLSYTTWALDVSAPGFWRAAVHQLAQAYVGLTEAWTHPGATIAVELPTQDTARKGDFGELITASLFSHRLGHEVPFQKLELMRPAANVTVQGPDVMALTLCRERTPKPALVESKLRLAISPKEVLEEIRTSLGRIDQDYIVSAWRAAHRAMRLHPASRKQFALSAAELLAQLSASPGTYPTHDKQAVIVTARPTLTVAKVEEHWGEHPPVTELHVVAVPRLEEMMDVLYEHAGNMTYGDVASGAPHLLAGATPTPGLAAPVISDEAVSALRLADGETSPVLLVEASLWLLADWDGIGTARARALAEKTTDRRVEGLARLLTGAAATARRTLSAHPVLARFASAVADAWARTITAEQLSVAATEAAKKVDDPGIALGVRYIGAAVRHRLPRHPATMVEAAGADGANVLHVVRAMLRYGKQAFWPSQSAAIQGGLLDRAQPSMAIKMPTSAGKTTLVELVAADALDAEDDGVAVVLAPTKALVRQLSSDLRKALPRAVAVRSSHGGLDFDIEGPSADGLLGEAGVVVVTPERFDLEWRQELASANGDTTIDRIRILVVDEAHLITEMGRGPRLELILGRAIRAGIRVVLLSSQLPVSDELAPADRVDPGLPAPGQRLAG